MVMSFLQVSQVPISDAATAQAAQVRRGRASRIRLQQIHAIPLKGLLDDELAAQTFVE
jgi:hypothetical protein